jgi:hypothetical protein
MAFNGTITVITGKDDNGFAWGLLCQKILLYVCLRFSSYWL